MKKRFEEEDKHVALLAEGVDRNLIRNGIVTINDVALLAEGVDRNLAALGVDQVQFQVALLAEGVDRNKCRFRAVKEKLSRPPRGGRG